LLVCHSYPENGELQKKACISVIFISPAHDILHRRLGAWGDNVQQERARKKERRKGLKSNGTQIPIIKTYLQKHKEGHSSNLIIL